MYMYAVRTCAIRAEAVLDPKVAFKRNHGSGARFLMASAIQISSSDTYKNHWNNWKKFMTLWVETDVLQDSDLFLIRPGGTGDDMLPMRAQVETCAAFCHYAVTELHHQPGTIISALAGIRHWFRTNGMALDVFSNPSLLAAKTGLALAQRRCDVDSEISRSTRDKKRMYPATLDMVEHIVSLNNGRNAQMKQRMIATATQLAFFCLLRVSEYVPYYKQEERELRCHAMQGKDVEFELFKDGVTSTVKAERVTKDMWPFVTLVRFELRHSKNDKMRVGSVFWFRNLPEAAGINIVRAVFDWICLSKPTAESYLMSFRSQNGHVCCLKYHDIAQAVKLAAQCQGFNPKNFSTHSLRVGGACLLRAGSAPDSMIQLLGRWKSLTTCLGYQESSMREFDTMQLIMRDRSLFTAKDVRLIHSKSDDS